MQRATRDFIEARKRYSRFFVERAYVKPVGDGIAGHPLAIARAGCKEGARIVSGWLVHPFDNVTQSTKIVPHWWNVDAGGRHFDLAQIRFPSADYVLDMELLERGGDRLDYPDLMHNHGGFIAVDDIEGRPIVRRLPSLVFEGLFCAD
jgi:hypothetical protein